VVKGGMGGGGDGMELFPKIFAVASLSLLCKWHIFVFTNDHHLGFYYSWLALSSNKRNNSIAIQWIKLGNRDVIGDW